MRSAQNGLTGRIGNEGAVRSRAVVASFDTYAEAERAVDYLADHDFPVQATTVVGEGVRLVEQPVGRFGLADAALRGALSGAMTGLLIGWLFAIFDWFSPSVARGWLILDGLWFGALVGLLMGLLAHAVTRGRRDFASVAGLQADRYDLLVEEQYAPEAARLLQQLGTGKAGAPAEAAAEPAAVGGRVDGDRR
jgi:hypothetical protein